MTTGPSFMASGNLSTVRIQFADIGANSTRNQVTIDKPVSRAENRVLVDGVDFLPYDASIPFEAVIMQASVYMDSGSTNTAISLRDADLGEDVRPVFRITEISSQDDAQTFTLGSQGSHYQKDFSYVSGFNFDIKEKSGTAAEGLALSMSWYTVRTEDEV